MLTRDDLLEWHVRHRKHYNRYANITAGILIVFVVFMLWLRMHTALPPGVDLHSVPTRIKRYASRAEAPIAPCRPIMPETYVDNRYLFSEILATQERMIYSYGYPVAVPMLYGLDYCILTIKRDDGTHTHILNPAMETKTDYGFKKQRERSALVPAEPPRVMERPKYAAIEGFDEHGAPIKEVFYGGAMSHFVQHAMGLLGGRWA